MTMGGGIPVGMASEDDDDEYELTDAFALSNEDKRVLPRLPSSSCEIALR